MRQNTIKKDKISNKLKAKEFRKYKTQVFSK